MVSLNQLDDDILNHALLDDEGDVIVLDSGIFRKISDAEIREYNIPKSMSPSPPSSGLQPYQSRIPTTKRFLK